VQWTLEVPAMTGSALAPVIIPIVAFVALFTWLALVYHANAHPSVHRQENRAAREMREAVEHQDTSAQELPRQDRRAA
jgi:hypothetical protein